MSKDFVGQIYNPEVKRLLEWRKEILLSFTEKFKECSKHHKEYINRLKELDWLLSKFTEK